MKADLLARRCGRTHKPADRVKHNLELGVVFRFQFFEFGGEVGMGREELAQANERAHDLDVDSNRPLAS
jgi:hypothetical protein